MHLLKMLPYLEQTSLSEEERLGLLEVVLFSYPLPALLLMFILFKGEHVLTIHEFK
jgi:hypothetical protein